MSRFIFVHDFYRDGYNDMLSEVQDLQAQGLWTKERRAKAAKHEVSTYHACKHKFPRMDMGYWAGRLAAIKSAATAHYPTQTVYRTPDGWDWNEHEIRLLPFPVPVGNKLVVKEHLEPEHIFFPYTATIGLAMLDLSFHFPLPMLLAQVVFVLHLTVKGKDYWQGFCKWMESEL